LRQKRSASLLHPTEHAPPPRRAPFGVPREVDEDGLPDEVVYGDEPPRPAVGGVVPVVAEDEEVVLPERVAVGEGTGDLEAASHALRRHALVAHDGVAVDGPRRVVEADGEAAGGDDDGAVVVEGEGAAEGEAGAAVLGGADE